MGFCRECRIVTGSKKFATVPRQEPRNKDSNPHRMKYQSTMPLHDEI